MITEKIKFNLGVDVTSDLSDFSNKMEDQTKRGRQVNK